MLSTARNCLISTILKTWSFSKQERVLVYKQAWSTAVAAPILFHIFPPCFLVFPDLTAAPSGMLHMPIIHKSHVPKGLSKLECLYFRQLVQLYCLSCYARKTIERNYVCIACCRGSSHRITKPAG